MGNCVYCGTSAGFLRKEHSECKQKTEQGRKDMVALAAEAVKSGKDLDTLRQRLASVAGSSFVPASEIKTALVQEWEQAVSSFLEDKVLSEDEEARLVMFSKQLDLTRADLDQNHAFTRVAMNAALREVLAGRVPSRQQVQGQLPFNFQKTESVVWVFPQVPYYEEKTTRSYVGGYQGGSVRIMKGV